MYLSSWADAVVTAYVDVTELMGAETYLYLLVEDQEITARVSARSTARSGDTIKVALDLSRLHLFDKDTTKAILH